MSKLFGRRVTVKVENATGENERTRFEISDLRVRFKIKKSLRPEPNTAEASITNLSRYTRAAMRAKGAKLSIFAGYEDFTALIFSGDARTIDHVIESPDWTTIVKCGDGERAYNFDRFSQSYGSGTNIATVLTDIVKKLKVDPGGALKQIGETFQNDTFQNGYVAHGRASTELDRILKGRGLEWSIQDGRLQLLEKGQTTNVITILSPESGLIGSPEHGTPDKKGGPTTLRVKSLLQPQIKPGGKIRIKTSTIDNALFYADAVEHEGDTAGGPWYTTVEALPLSA